MDDLAVADEVARPDRPAQLPPGDGEGLSGRPDGHGALPHVGEGRHADHLAAIEHLRRRRVASLFVYVHMCVETNFQRRE